MFKDVGLQLFNIGMLNLITFVVSSIFLFYLCKCNKKYHFSTSTPDNNDMKDRIRAVMESKNMGQQNFAQFIGMSPASLSSIFNGRTKPTLNIVEAIKAKIPNISTDWLLFGSGTMYENPSETDNQVMSNQGSMPAEPLLDFSDASDTPLVGRQMETRTSGVVMAPRKDTSSLINNIDKKTRKITEIRVFYDDNTWESFSPSK